MSSVQLALVGFQVISGELPECEQTKYIYHIQILI